MNIWQVSVVFRTNLWRKMVWQFFVVYSFVWIFELVIIWNLYLCSSICTDDHYWCLICVQFIVNVFIQDWYLVMSFKKQLTILMAVKVDLLMWCVYDIHSNMQFWNNVFNCVPLNMKFGIVLHRNKSVKCGRSFIFIIFVSCVRCCKVIWWRLFFTLNGRYSLFC